MEQKRPAVMSPVTSHKEVFRKLCRFLFNSKFTLILTENTEIELYKFSKHSASQMSKSSLPKTATSVPSSWHFLLKKALSCHQQADKGKKIGKEKKKLNKSGKLSKWKLFFEILMKDKFLSLLQWVYSLHK